LHYVPTAKCFRGHHDVGYLHRSAEKIGERLTPRQFLPYTDRLDYLAGMNMNLGWALAVEKLMGLEVTEKCRHVRVIACELSRIASHLVAAGCYGLDLGSLLICGVPRAGKSQPV
jgi:NADH-quinone oxidoreductase subunit D